MFTVALISPYKAQADEIRFSIDALGDVRFAAHTAEVVQGLQFSFVILDLVCGIRLTDFVNNDRRVLVMLTRHKYGLLVLASEFP